MLLVALVSFQVTVNCAHWLCESHFLYRSVIALTVNCLGQQTQFDEAKLDVKLMQSKSTFYRLVHGRGVGHTNKNVVFVSGQPSRGGWVHQPHGTARGSDLLRGQPAAALHQI